MADISKEDITAAVDEAMIEQVGFDSRGRRHGHPPIAAGEEEYPRMWELDAKQVVAGEVETTSRSRTHFDNGVLGFLNLVTNMNAVAVRIANNGALHDHLATLKSLDIKGAWTDKMLRVDESTLALKALYRPTVPTEEAIGASIASRALEIIGEKLKEE